MNDIYKNSETTMKTQLAFYCLNGVFLDQLHLDTTTINKGLFWPMTTGTPEYPYPASTKDKSRTPHRDRRDPETGSIADLGKQIDPFPALPAFSFEHQLYGRPCREARKNDDGTSFYGKFEQELFLEFVCYEVVFK